MRAGKNTFTIFAALLIVLVLFCMTRSDGFAAVPGYESFASAPGFGTKAVPKKTSSAPMPTGQMTR